MPGVNQLLAFYLISEKSHIINIVFPLEEVKT